VDSLETLVQDRAPASVVPSEAAPAGLPPSTPSARARPVRAGPRVAGEHPGDGSLLHGRYRLLERLGAGGFGVVWRAQDEQLHREVALKRIPLAPDLPALDGHDGLHTGERASREALATARLAHPAIVALYEAYVDDDAFYLISELVHGDTLALLLATDAICDEELLEIGVTLAHALAHAHARGVIHRDVKPQNVLVPHDPGTRETPAKLTDFGGASLVGEDALTRPGETLGTLAYMAPEQSEGREVGEPADLYSLALVLYEGLTGANPVRGPTPAATARRIGRALPPLAARRPDLPRALSHALDAALAIDPARRGTIEELLAALEQASTGSLTRRRGLLGRRRILAPSAECSVGEGSAEVGQDVAVERRPILTSHPASVHGDAHHHARRLAPERRLDAEGRPVASGDPVSHDTVRAPSRTVALPRAVWLGCALAAAAWQAASGRAGVALLVLAAAAPLLLLGPRLGVGWLTGMLAPLLGVVGLAGAYPALAGQASRWSQRAALGALGYWWLILAEPLLAGDSAAARLWLGPPAGMPSRTVWEGSLDSAAAHVVGPALTLGVLLGAVLWAAGAVVLPWVVRGSNAVLDTITAVAWSAALLAVTPYFDAGLSPGAVLAHPRGAVLGAILGAVIAVAARALRGPVRLRHP
jgi:eukaryotic-like serine/threonine-protein kinase